MFVSPRLCECVLWRAMRTRASQPNASLRCRPSLPLRENITDLLVAVHQSNADEATILLKRIGGKTTVRFRVEIPRPAERD